MSSPPKGSTSTTGPLADEIPPIPPAGDTSASSSSTSTIYWPSPPRNKTTVRMNRPLFPSRLPSDQLHQLLSTHPHRTQLPSEVDPYSYSAHETHRRMEEEERASSSIPEKCLTFCSQRADAPPMCRMFCLRKRKPLETREEHLARLRPQRRQVGSEIPVAPETDTSTMPGHSESWQAANYFFPSSSAFLPPVLPRYAASSSTSQSSETTSISSSKSSSSGPSPQSGSPFEALRRRVEPYSFIYVRGAPEGPVGRYMEELECDDGHNDFGMASRGAGEIMKRKRYEPQLEYIDWGEEGSVLSLPFTSIFGPIIAIPATLDRILSPSIRFLTLYRDSFTSGGQTRNFEKFQKELSNGSALQMIDKFQAYWAKKAKAREEEMERERAQNVGKGE